MLRLVREVLSCRPEQRGTDVARALALIDAVTRRRAMVFVLSDFQSAGDPAAATAKLRRALRMARRRHDVVALRVTDPRERELPDVGLLTVEDAETGELIEIDTGSPRVLAEFAARTAAREAELEHTLRQESIDSVPIDTSVPYLPALVQLFRARGRRRR